MFISLPCRNIIRSLALATWAWACSGVQAQEIRNHASAVCVDTTGGGLRSSAAAWPCNGQGNQKFVLRDFGPDLKHPQHLPSYHVKFGELCLSRSEFGQGPPYIFQECKVGADGRPDWWQTWWFDTNFPGNVNARAGLLRPHYEHNNCLDLSGGSNEWTVDILLRRPLPLVVQTCNGGLSQRWWVTVVK